jgi:hypothetical protein
MLKRLLTAVLILAMFMVFTGTAFSDATNVPGYDKNDTRVVGQPKAPSVKEKALTPKSRAGGPITEPAPVAYHFRTPLHSTSGSDTTTCDFTNYYNHEPGTCDGTFLFRANNAFPRYAMRFDGPSLPGYKVQVNGAAPYVYRATEGGPTDGQVGITAEVWTDVGGLPAVKVYAETFIIPVIPSGSDQYVYLPFANPPLMSGSYHIAIRADSTGPALDSLIVGADWSNRAASGGCPAGTYAPSFRSSRYQATPAGWFPQLAVNGFTVNFDLYSDNCMVYSDCYTDETPNGNSFQIVYCPDPLWGGGNTLQGVGQRFVTTGPDTIKSVTLWHYDLGEYPLAGTNGVDIQIWGDSAGDPAYSAGPLATVTLSGRAALFTTPLGGGWNGIVVPIPSMPVVLGAYHVTAKMTNNNDATGALEFLVNHGVNDPGRTGGSVSFTGTGSPVWQRTGVSTPWAIYTLGERAFLFDVDLCHDEFSICQYQVTHDGMYDVNWGMGWITNGGFSRRGVAQMIVGGRTVSKPSVSGSVSSTVPLVPKSPSARMVALVARAWSYGQLI